MNVSLLDAKLKSSHYTTRMNI